jgi:hypothetical protein
MSPPPTIASPSLSTLKIEEPALTVLTLRTRSFASRVAVGANENGATDVDAFAALSEEVICCALVEEREIAVPELLKLVDALKDLAPPIVWLPAVNTPGLVPSAGSRFRVVVVMVAPLALGTAPTAAIVVTPPPPLPPILFSPPAVTPEAAESVATTAKAARAPTAAHRQAERTR